MNSKREIILCGLVKVILKNRNHKKVNMLEMETLRKQKHERKRKQSHQRSRSQTGIISRKESSLGKFGNFEIISYAPISRRQSGIMQLTIGRSPSVIEKHSVPSSSSCILNANSNQHLFSDNEIDKAVNPKELSGRESSLDFLRNSKLRSSPYRSKTVMSQNREAKKVEKVFLSEKQTKPVRECGSIVPGAPPATPTSMLMKRIEYVPSMTDIRAQRSLQGRLQSMKSVQNARIEKEKKDKEKQEKLNLAERLVDYKKTQRNVIYALNDLMRRCENSRFQEYINRNGLNG